MRFSCTIWGARGSIPCTGDATRRYGGDTACLDLTIGARRVLIDAGSGLAVLGMTHGDRAFHGDLLLSHGHLDHVQGLPFFAPAYRADSRIRLWRADPDPFAPLLAPPLSPVTWSMLRGIAGLSVVRGGDVLDLGDGITVRTATLNHPGGALGFRVEAAGKVLVTLFDHEPGNTSCDAAVLDLARDADLLVVDATFEPRDWPDKRGWGHGTWTQACDLAATSGARRLLLFHHDPRNDDAHLDAIERAAQDRFAGTACARQGSVIDL